MAHLLGTQYCLESLSKDVADLQETIQNILRKVGRIEYTSWKFPSKNATDLNINELLEDYSYCKDEASNRLSHIIMFELVIDRFCLLLQVVSKLFEQITSVQSESRPASKTVTATMSIGLVCKTFWSKVSQFQYSYQKQEKELSQHNQSLMDLETSFTELKLQNDQLRRKDGKHPVIYSDKDVQLEPMFNSGTHMQILTTVSTQTFETAFAECEICSKLQSSLIDIGGCVLNICETQNLPSSVSKHNKILKSCKLSSSIVEKWSMEFIKDLKKVLHCVQDNERENNTLKKQLQIYKTKIETLENENSIVSADRDTLQKSEEKLLAQCNSLKELVKSYEQNQDSAKNKIEELQAANELLKKGLDCSTEELGKHKISIRALEQGMNSLSLQLEAQENEHKEVGAIKNQLQHAMEQKKLQETELNAANQELEKLKSENKVLLKHDQGLQTKQSSLLSRMEQLDERCEELQNEMNEMADEKQQTMEENEKFMKEINKLQDELERKNRSFEASPIPTTKDSSQYEQDLLEISEKLKLVVMYPVLGEEYKTIEERYIRAVNYGDNVYTEDGDVVEDMKLQIQANTTRIAILEQQNLSLRHSLVKLEATEEICDGQSKEKQILHGNGSTSPMSEENHLSYHPTAKSAPNRLMREEMPLEPRPPSLPRLNEKIQRPRSGGRRNEDFQSRLSDLERMKNSNVIGTQQNDWTSKSGSGSEFNVASFVCPDCGKEHTSQRDLDIHRPFCFGRL